MGTPPCDPHPPATGKLGLDHSSGLPHKAATAGKNSSAALDFLPGLIILHPSCSLRGASGGVRRMEQDAAPAGWARNPALGRPRDPPAGHYEPAARSSLMRAGAPVQ